MPLKYYYRKPYRVKRKKPILRSRVFWIGTLSALAIAGIYYFLFFSDFFKIKKITISGDQIISEENVRPFIRRDNIFLTDTKDIQRNILNNFLQVAEAKVRKRPPNALNIIILKRLAVALWCEEEKCFFVDNNAVIFGQIADERFAPSEVEGLIKIIGAKEMLNKEKVSQILNIQKIIKDGSMATTTQAFVVSEERLNIKTTEGWEIYFNLKGNLDWQLQELGRVLEKQISPQKRKNLEYINLRFSRVYYK